MSQQPHTTEKAVNSVLGCIRRNVSNRSREVILPLHSALLGLWPEYCLQFWHPQHKREMDALERGQQRATVMIRGARNSRGTNSTNLVLLKPFLSKRGDQSNAPVRKG